LERGSVILATQEDRSTDQPWTNSL
jgi:hypothetical protein